MIALFVLLPLVAALPPGGDIDPAAAAKNRGPETADWVPFKGRLRLSRTWRHRGGHGFPSVDFDLPTGKSIRVRAAGPGTVLAVVDDCPDIPRSGAGGGCNGGEGNLVDVVHPDGRRSRYLHLRRGSAVVSPGDHVCRGCPIARSGWSGNVSPKGPAGAHIHYEEIQGYRTVPPGPMFAKHKGKRVRYPRGGWRRAGAKRVALRNSGFPRPGPAPAGRCAGFAPTIVGTAAAEAITGTAGPDIILGGDGSDTIRGGDGEDRLCGEGGNDTLLGGAQDDVLDGGAGFDVCHRGESSGADPGGGGTAAGCERPPFVLTVQVDSAGIVVESDPPGISCPTTSCVAAFDEGVDVRLQASGVGSAAWAGCDSASFNACTVTMWSDRTVRA